MGSYNHDIANTWSTTSIASSVVNTGATATTSGAISNDGTLGNIVGVAVTLTTGTVSGQFMVYILAEVNGNYQTVADRPIGRAVPVVASGTSYITLFVPTSIDDFKVHVVNNCGVNATSVDVVTKAVNGVTA